MHVLALDPGSLTTGVAIVSPTQLLFHGVWHFKGQLPARVLDYDCRLRALLRQWAPVAVVCEDFTFQHREHRTSTATWRDMGMLLGITLCTQNHGGPPVVLVNAGTWQRQLVGKGSYGKDRTRWVVEQRLGIAPTAWKSTVSADGKRGGHDSDAAGIALYFLDTQHRHNAQRRAHA